MPRPCTDPRCELHPHLAQLRRLCGGDPAIDEARACARRIGREPMQTWQALDLTCAVCGRTPCDTPTACTEAMMR
jgi:hypothetical protein